jgi:hypothetical protein
MSGLPAACAEPWHIPGGQGAAHVVFQMQSLKLARVGPGPDGVATTVPLLVASCISSTAWKRGFAPLRVALVKCTVPRLGMAASPVPRSR